MPYQPPDQRHSNGRRGNATPAVVKFRARMGRMLHNPVMLRRFVAGALPRVGNLQHENATEAVRLVLRGQPLARVARDLGVPVSTVAYWYERFEQHVTNAAARARDERVRRGAERRRDEETERRSAEGTAADVPTSSLRLCVSASLPDASSAPAAGALP